MIKIEVSSDKDFELRDALAAAIKGAFSSVGINIELQGASTPEPDRDVIHKTLEKIVENNKFVKVTTRKLKGVNYGNAK